MIPSLGYDPTMVYHQLAFKCRCHEAHATEFQRLFEEIMVRARPGFERIKPHGRLGDRKTDGLLRENGIVYQVYAPYEIDLSELKNKVDKDLVGAISYWQDDLREWVFVYNAPHGAPADIFKVLNDKQKEHPQITIGDLSNDQLWEIMRTLPLQQRIEVLGVPPSDRSEMFVYPSPHDNFSDISDPWIMIIHDPVSPVSLKSATDALLPNKPFGAPFYIRPAEFLDWNAAAEHQHQKWEEIRSISWDLSPQYALFSIAPIPLAVHLGFLLSDRVNVACFHYHRDDQTWSWPDSGIPEGLALDLRSTVTGKHDAATDVALCVSLSAPVLPAQLERVVEPDIPLFEITARKPGRFWLRSPEQLRELGRKFLVTLDEICAKVPNYQRIHLFYAGPSAGAVIIGRSINPRMTRPVELYQYSTQTSPQYQHALTLIDTGVY